MFRVDLSTYMSDDVGESVTELVAVGWLDSAVDFPKGEVDRRLVEQVKRLCVHERVAVTRGFHQCNIGACSGRPPYPPLKCDIDGEQAILGSSEIRVPALDGKYTFAAPNLIVHYVEAHGYVPPPAFLQAVMSMDNGK